MVFVMPFASWILLVHWVALKILQLLQMDLVVMNMWVSTLHCIKMFLYSFHLILVNQLHTFSYFADGEPSLTHFLKSSCIMYGMTRHILKTVYSVFYFSTSRYSVLSAKCEKNLQIMMLYAAMVHASVLFTKDV